MLYIYMYIHTHLCMFEQRRYAYIQSFVRTYKHTYILAKLYFACASSMVAIFYFILLLSRCLHVHELTNLFTHSCTKLLLIQNASEIAHISLMACVFSHSIKLEMTCASKFQMLHKHTHTQTHGWSYQCVCFVHTYVGKLKIHICTYIHCMYAHNIEACVI